MRRILQWMLLLPAAGLAVPVLVDSALKGAILMALILAAVILLRNASAALRHLVLVAAMVGLLVLPVLSVSLPGWRVLPAWAQTRGIETESVHPETSEIGSDYANAAMAESTLPIAAEAEVISPTTNWAALAVWLWLAGGVLFGLRLALSQCLLLKLGRRARRCEDAGLLAMLEELKPTMGVGRRVELLLHPARSMPMTWGIFKTRLLLPAEAVDWDEGRVRAVLLHEIAHVKRRDCLTLFLVQTVCAVHWFNPLVWVAARKIAAERERACDDLVLNSGVRASDYAEHLLRIATGYEDRPITAAAALAMARKSRLEGRLTSILNQRTNRCNITRRVALVVAIGLVLLAMPVAMMRAVADEADDDKSIEELAAEWAAENLKDEDGRTIFTMPDGTDVFIDRKPDRIADTFFLEDFEGTVPRIDPVESDEAFSLAVPRMRVEGFYIRGEDLLDSISIYNHSSKSQKFAPLVGYKIDLAKIINSEPKPSFVREFLGGASNLRGYDYRGAGTDLRYFEKKPIHGNKMPMVRVEPGPGSEMRPAAGERLGGKAFVDGYNHVDPAKTRRIPAGADPLLLSDRSGLGSERLPDIVDTSKVKLKVADFRDESLAKDTQLRLVASTLAKLEVERAEAAQKYRAHSPKMVSMDARIELLRDALKKRHTFLASTPAQRLEAERKRLSELLASGLGAIHPRVKQVKASIAALEQLIAQKAKQEAKPVVLKLQKSQAAQVKAAIDGVIGRSRTGRVVVDADTNSLIYIGDAKTLELVRSMLEHLDK